MENRFDAIVIGAGGSGLAAAVSAAEHGGRVLVLEKCDQPGGTTGIAIGSFTAAGTSLQSAAKIEDSPRAHVEDVEKFAEAAIEEKNNSAQREFFLYEAADTLEWLRGMGITFVGPNPEPPNRVPRMHNAVPGAKAYIATLQMGVNRLGGKILCNARAESLISHQMRVVGVNVNHAGNQRSFHAARGVILAAGDYSNSSALIARHKGKDFRSIEGINPHATGDGHRLVQQVGGCLVNMDVCYGPELRFVASANSPFRQLLPTTGLKAKLLGACARRMPAWLLRNMIKRLLVTWQHPEDGLFDDGALLVNRLGHRFINERESPAREIAVANQPDKLAYILLDAGLVRRYSAWPYFISTAPDIAYAYVRDYQRLRPDITVTGTSLSDLAVRSGLPGTELQRTVAQYRAYLAGKQPDLHGRRNDVHAIEDGNWVLLGPLRAYFTTTEGGAMVNRRLQVLDARKCPIQGLFAAGQNGLGGMILWGHGLHIAWALTSGRLAGRFVMEETNQ